MYLQREKVNLREERIVWLLVVFLKGHSEAGSGGVCGGKLKIGTVATRMKNCYWSDTDSSRKQDSKQYCWPLNNAAGVVRDADLPHSWRTQASLIGGPWYLWLPCISSSASADSTNHRSYSTVYLLLKKKTQFMWTHAVVVQESIVIAFSFLPPCNLPLMPHVSRTEYGTIGQRKMSLAESQSKQSIKGWVWSRPTTA